MALVVRLGEILHDIQLPVTSGTDLEDAAKGAVASMTRKSFLFPNPPGTEVSITSKKGQFSSLRRSFPFEKKKKVREAQKSLRKS